MLSDMSKLFISFISLKRKIVGKCKTTSFYEFSLSRRTLSLFCRIVKKTTAVFKLRTS